VRGRTLFPLALAVGYALWTFWPQPAALPGWGEDPYNSLWTFEDVWRQMDRLGPLHMYDRAFWEAPIFAGTPIALAFSENELHAALLLRPLQHALGAVPAMWLGGIALTLLAFGCTLGWLHSLGIRELAGAGALLFACCGFVQSHAAHYQNLCIFVLPLALWSWAALEREPGPLRAAPCALAFGWIGGWNFHFQLFADLMLCALALLRRNVPLRWRAAALAGAALIQAPIALKYLEAQRQVGSFAVTLTYGALPQSVLGTSMRPTLLQQYLPGYPRVEVPIEAAGFLGISWCALLVVALARRGARGWAIAALLSFWAALGLGYGLFDLLHLLPGFAGLRAAGRFQVLTALFGVPAALLALEGAHGLARWIPLAAAALELAPASPVARVPVPADLDRRPTAFDRVVAGRGPLLAVPELNGQLQLYLLRSDAPVLQGVSSHAPANVELVDSFFTRRPWMAGSLQQLLELTRPPLVVTADARWSAELSRSPLLEPQGCFAHLDAQICLFRPGALPAPPLLRLDRDTVWETGTSATGWPVARLRATRAGVLDYAALGRCKLREETRFPHLPAFTRDLHFPGAQLEGSRFEPGQLVLARESRQRVLRWPEWIRPTRSYAVRCD